VSVESFTLFGTLATAVITVGGAWLKEALQRRSREQVRERFLRQVKEEIAMIEAWAKAHAALGSTAEPPPAVRERAQRDLDQAYDRMARLAPQLPQPITLSLVLSRLFLRYVRPTSKVRLLRSLYYIALAMLVVWGLAGFFDPAAWSTPSTAFATIRAYLAVAVAPAWLLGWITCSTARHDGAVTGLSPRRGRESELLTGAVVPAAHTEVDRARA
jgi:hypothetical protein